MSSFLEAVKGIGAVILHLGEQVATDPKVEAAVATLLEQMIAARVAQAK